MKQATKTPQFTPRHGHQIKMMKSVFKCSPPTQTFKNAGGTLLCPDNKLMCLLGTGASATAIEVNFKELVMNCNLVTPTIEELSECKTASKVSELEAPNKTGLVTYPGSASFLAAPWLVKAVVAANSSTLSA
jgi:hypothetical protein